MTYQVFGPPGTLADISYFDVDADPQRVEGASCRGRWNMRRRRRQSWETLRRRATATALAAASWSMAWSKPRKSRTR